MADIPEKNSSDTVIDGGEAMQEKTMIIQPEIMTDQPAGGRASVDVAVGDAVFDVICRRLKQYVKGELPADLLPMGEWDLCTHGQLSETDIVQAYSAATHIAVLSDEDLEQVATMPDISSTYLSHWLCLPVSWDAASLSVAVVTPYDLDAMAVHWQHLYGRKTTFFLAQRSHIERLIEALYGQTEEEFHDSSVDWDGDASEEALRDLALEAPVVRLVNDIFARAVEMRASDIHVEPQKEELTIRFRVDGILQTVLTPPIKMFPAIASRLKLIGGLNIAERRLPQDGRTNLTIGRAEIDIRLSTVPSMHGESIVLRILRKDTVDFSLENIGITKEIRDPFSRLIQMPHGMILVVGPTGSGKTTTLYCAMGLLNSEKSKIITIEDPIEYQIDGVTQIQVRPNIGLTFASGLRHIVRQDPDIILVGEIRDRETAEIAIHAALTGHLVLSTLHTNDATGAVGRMLDMGVEAYLISSALIGVMSQRLVRRVCKICDGNGLVDADGKAGKDLTRDIGKVCRNCQGSGYRGRVGIFEYFQINEEIRRHIGGGIDNASLRAVARDHGLIDLRVDGEAKAAAGLTTRAEVAQVCQLDMG